MSRATTPGGATRVLVAEDDEVDFAVLRRHLSEIQGARFEVDRARDYESAFAITRRMEHDVYVFDYHLGVETAIGLLREVVALGSFAPVIVMTGADDRAVDLDVMKAGATDYLVKDELSAQLLERSIRYALERHRLIEELRALSLRDGLTGLYNRRAFVTLAEQQLRMARRSGQGVAVVFADIDGLKAINDRHGHRAGDDAIVALARVLQRTFRESDVVARLGGDEFVVLAADADTTLELAGRRLFENLDEYNARRLPHERLSLSIGVAVCDGRSEASVEELMATADRDLYARRRGRRAS